MPHKSENRGDICITLMGKIPSYMLPLSKKCFDVPGICRCARSKLL